MPCTYPVAENSDDYVLESGVCMMPDILAPITTSGVTARSGIWQSFYIMLSGLFPGKHVLKFSVSASNGEILGEIEYTLTVLSKRLPDSDLICTFWLHYDSLADYYKLPLFSEEYNRILQSFLCSAVNHGLTMLLTPLFTPPLDTEIGKERMTVQLIDIEKKNGEYRFGFERLEQFMKFAEQCGVRYFEMPHLFTQWGAGFAPKIMATEDGKEKRISGGKMRPFQGNTKSFSLFFCRACVHGCLKKIIIPAVTFISRTNRTQRLLNIIKNACSMSDNFYRTRSLRMLCRITNITNKV